MTDFPNWAGFTPEFAQVDDIVNEADTITEPWYSAFIAILMEFLCSEHGISSEKDGSSTLSAVNTGVTMPYPLIEGENCTTVDCEGFLMSLLYVVLFILNAKTEYDFIVAVSTSSRCGSEKESSLPSDHTVLTRLQ